MIKIVGLLLIISFVVMVSGCTSNDNPSNNNTDVGSELENNILIENMTITPSSVGEGYDIVFLLTYTGDRPINYRLWIETYPAYGSTQGSSDLPNQLIQPIKKGDSFKIEMADMGGMDDDPSGITGFKFLIGVNYEETEDSFYPDDSFYTEIYPVKKA